MWAGNRGRNQPNMVPRVSVCQFPTGPESIKPLQKQMETKPLGEPHPLVQSKEASQPGAEKKEVVTVFFDSTGKKIENTASKGMLLTHPLFSWELILQGSCGLSSLEPSPWKVTFHWAKEESRPVKCLLHKHKDPGCDSRFYVKSQALCHTRIIPVLGRLRWTDTHPPPGPVGQSIYPNHGVPSQWETPSQE